MGDGNIGGSQMSDGAFNDVNNEELELTQDAAMWLVPH